ncbi:kelch repeat-containing protein [Dyadobacter sp. CY356]|uniref:Kelch repeat-containing protein n=1 Tax=Dyadobacter sp. CY356 TaxID=2906442 RepID=UPI001F33EF47|nr:kelch repeat-containing protein [Dyadobacter sp. CY356]MCF0054899.1 galactose oxidase [Dyadobacter sp. CY356]
MFNTLKKSSLTLLIASTALFQFGCDNDSDPDKVGNWYKKGLPSFGGTPRNGAVSFMINNIGYIGTGYTNQSVARAKDFWSYDASTKIWSQVAPFGGTTRNDAVAFVSGGKAYVGTGYDGDLTTFNGYKKDFYQYTPSTNTWKAVADFPGLPRQYASAFTVGDNGYVGLGFSDTGYFQDIYKYDAASDTWTEMATFLGGKRRGATTFTIGNIAYVGFGSNNSGVNFRDLYQFEATGNGGKGTWTQKTVFDDDEGDFPTARANALGLVINNLGYVIAGAGNSDVWEYNPTNDTWIEKTTFNGGVRGYAAGFVIGNIGYLGTGGTSSARYDDFWGFDPTAADDDDDDVN